MRDTRMVQISQGKQYNTSMKISQTQDLKKEMRLEAVKMIGKILILVCSQNFIKLHTLAKLYYSIPDSQASLITLTHMGTSIIPTSVLMRAPVFNAN